MRQAPDLTYPPIEELLRRVGSKFALAVLSARRAREITSYYGQLDDSFGSTPPPQVTSIARKPLTIALEEICSGKVRLGEGLDRAYFALASAVLEGSPVDIYLGTSSHKVLDSSAHALQQIAELTGRRLELVSVEPGSFFARFKPYGDGRNLTDKESREVAEADTIRPIAGQESDLAVELSRGARRLAGSVEQAGFVAAIGKDVLFAQWLDEEGRRCVAYREITPQEWSAYQAGRLDLRLSDPASVLSFLDGRPALRKQA